MAVVVVLLMALLRIKRPEGLKEHLPEDLGRLLGLDRAPEVETLRRKLTRLASIGQATAFGRALAERLVAFRGAALGFLYVDGHVRVYHGQRTLPKTDVARMRLVLPATSDYWVNDANGDPLFVITAEANAGMVKMLPLVLRQTRDLLGDRRITSAVDLQAFSLIRSPGLKPPAAAKRLGPTPGSTAPNSAQGGEKGGLKLKERWDSIAVVVAQQLQESQASMGPQHW